MLPFGMESKSIGVEITWLIITGDVFVVQFPNAAFAIGETEKINKTSAMTCRQGVFLL